MFFITVIVCVFLQKCGAVIYNLNESTYAQLPALYALDDWEGCVARGGAYCLVDASVRGSGPLYDLLLVSGGRRESENAPQEYSADTQQHFNHTQIHRGVCATYCNPQSQQDPQGPLSHQGLQGIARNDSRALAAAITRCLNHSLMTSHGLQAEVTTVLYCQREDDEEPLDAVDLLVAVVYLLILALNVVGTAYDLIFCSEVDKAGNPYLLSFSLRRSWRRLTGVGAPRDPKMESLQLFNGLRTMTMFCVFFSHTTLIMSYSYVQNPRYIETSYSDPLKQLLFNGSLVTHTFFVMSAFLLAYNYLGVVETRGASWTMLPRGLVMRWLRLTPAYAVALGGAATWLRAAGRGPLAPLLLRGETAACRRWWWAHLLYVNNYIYDDALCAPQTWYLAADTQLFAIGLLLCVCTRTSRSRIVALVLMFFVAVAIVAGQTYYQDLEAVVIQSPEKSYRALYAHDDTFRLLYVRGHSNLASYVLGLAAGFIAYSGQKRGFSLKPYKRWRLLYWLIFPIAVLVIISGVIWYGGGEVGEGGMRRAGTPLTRSLYAALYKPLFQFLVVSFILGAVFKIESVYRSIVSWRGWAWAGRASYCAFLLHTAVQRAFMAGARQPTHMDEYYIVVVLSATIFMSYTCGAILYLLVEAPSAAFIKAATTPRKKEDSQL